MTSDTQAAALHGEARHSDHAHQLALAVGGYSPGLSGSLVDGDEAVKVSHAFMATVQRIGADLIAQHRAGTIHLPDHPDALRLVAYLSGSLDQYL
ncbi:hypothetical protein [Oerskovia merdavium]|nr:hypothetical protein [Oerskovia merdavium]